MIIDKLWLHNFRSYEALEIDLAAGLNAIVGANGSGKTNLLEAVNYLAKLKSFRLSPTQSLIKQGADEAVIRATGTRAGREVLIEIALGGTRPQVLVNKQKLSRNRDILGALRTTIFSPDDLSLVKGGPGLRREYLDDLLVGLDTTKDQLVTSVNKILKQRNSLLKQIFKKPDESQLATLDVWDKRLSEASGNLLDARLDLLRRLRPYLEQDYSSLAGEHHNVQLTYLPSWEGLLFDTLLENRDNDIRRSVTTAGPHRDDISIVLNGFSSRTQASQGEQRTLALALRLAGHRLMTDTVGEPPLLLLDDVLSELDPSRSVALLDNLPDGQTIITSAIDLPPEIKAEKLIEHLSTPHTMSPLPNPTETQEDV